jgi:sulfur relay (sulfurtransferase) DsrF/TusC family protein
MLKKVLVLIREGPFSHTKNPEALRVALGLTLSDLKVTVVFLDQGALAAGEVRPDIISRPEVKPYWENFSVCGVEVMVDRKSKERMGLDSIRPGVEVVQREDVLSRIASADFVLRV